MIDLEDRGLYINSTLKTWERQGDNPRRACVSSFGMGGTLAHAVIEEYVEAAEDQGATAEGRGPYVILVSAKTAEQLNAMVDHLKDYLANNVKMA